MKYLFFLLLYFGFCPPVFSQAPALDSILDKFSKDYMPEQVYIQYDKSVYLPGETIWFKAYLMTDVLPSNSSKNFYIDWADDKGNIIAHQSYPIAFSSTYGQFDLPEDYTGSSLQVQAYTKWMLNFDSSFLYRKSIRVAQDDITATNKRKQKDIDTLYFFPEGGNIIAGLENKIAFKAVNNHQVLQRVNGFIKNGAGQVIDSFRTQHDGMGYFYLQPAPEETYSVEWTDGSGQTHLSELPPVKSSGVSLQVESTGGERKFMIRRTKEVDESLKQLHIVASQGQQLIFAADVEMENKTAAGGTLSVAELPSGIVRFTLFNKDWLPMAERICFVNNSKHIFSPQINVDTVSFEKRGKNVFSIDVPDTLRANLSIAITDAGVAADSSDNIISRLLLTNELKGPVYKPAYYFSDSSLQTQQDLDLVMLTNGWRRYDWEQITKGIYPVLKYQKDSAFLSLSGQVTGKSIDKVKAVKPTFGAKWVRQTPATKFGKPIAKPTKQPISTRPIKPTTSIKPVQLIPANSRILLYVRSIHDTTSQMVNFILDSSGHFENPALLVFDSLQVRYQFSDRKMNLKSLEVIFMPDRLSQPVTMTVSSSLDGYSTLSSPAPYNDLPSFTKARLLKTVDINAKIKTSAEILEDRYTSNIFRGTFGYNIDVQSDTKADNAINILWYLQMKAPGLQITFPGSPASPPVMKWSGARSEYGPAIYYNEHIVPVDYITNINMSEIAYVKVIPPPAFPASTTSGAIAVYAKKGADFFGGKSTDLPRQTIVGYSVIRYFTAPDYSYPEDNAAAEDKRTTLYWNPLIITSPAERHIKIQFYNNDYTKTYRVIMEGVTKDGRLTRIEKLVSQ